MRQKILAYVGTAAIALCLALGTGAGAASPIQIGCITPLTGEGATYGAATQHGVHLALDEINRGGGIKGSRVAVVCEDDQMSPRIGSSAIEKLVDVNKVPVILGAFGSSVTLAVAPIAQRRKVVLLSASSTADALSNAGPYFFRNVPTNRKQGDTAARFARMRLKARTATIFQMNNDYGVSLGNAFKTAFQSDGGRVLAVESYNPGTTDFRAQLTKIRARAPDIVFFPGQYQESGLILKQAREIGLRATFVGGDGSYSPELARIAGAAAERSYYTLMAMGYGVADAKIDRFSRVYRARYHDDPDVYSAYAYDATLIIGKAIEKGGYTADGIKSALHSIRFDGVTGRTQFDRNGQVDKPFGVYQLKGGKFVIVRGGNS